MKKILSVIVTVALIFSCCFIGNVFAVDTINVWDGVTLTAPKDSNGDGVKEIGTAAEFAWLGANGGNDSYILTNDIYLNDLVVDVSGENVVLKKFDGTVITDTSTLNIWSGTATFGGTLDGNGYTVNGMFNDTDSDLGTKCAMFGELKSTKHSIIKNIKVLNTYFAGATYQAVFFGNDIGSWTTATINNCYVENVYLSSSLKEDNYTHPTVGGLVGYIQAGHLNVDNVGVSNIKLSSVGNRYGAFLGDAYNSGNMTITNSYNATAYQTFGGNNGNANNYKGVMTSKFMYSATANAGAYAPAVTVVSLEQMRGKNATVSMWELGENFYTTEKFPIQEIFVGTINPEINVKLGVEPIEIWDGITYTAPKDVNGDGIIEIGSASEFAWLGLNGGNGSYILTSNIYLNDLVVDVSGDDVVLKKLDGSIITDMSTLNIWAGTASFYGTVDGNGHKVSGMFNDEDAALGTKRGMFGSGVASKTTVIKNLILTNTYFKGATYQSAFVGFANSWATIEINNCYVENIYLESSTLKDKYTNPTSGVLLGYQACYLNVYNVGVSNIKFAGGDSTRYGAFLGDAYTSRGFNIKNSYNATKYHTFGGNNSSTNNYVNNIVSEFVYSATANKGACAPAVTVVSLGGMSGKNALINMWEIGGNFYTTKTFPMQEIFLKKINPEINKQLGSEPDLIEGVGVSVDSANYYKMSDLLSAFPKTVEANLFLGADVSNSTRGGVIVGNYASDTKGVYNLEINTYGHPNLYLVLPESGGIIDVLFDQVDVRTGAWLNLAIVYDEEANNVTCYVDGEAVQTKNVDEFVPYVPATELMVGVDARDMLGHPFVGAIGSVNLFSSTRTSEQIKSDINEIDLTDNSLMASYSFSDAYMKNVADASANGNTLINQGMFYMSDTPKLDKYAYSFVIVGDTQFMNHSHIGNYGGIYDWIVNNIESYNIKHVFGMGDITNMNSDNEWKRAVTQHAKLDGKVSYSLVRGNHDGYHWDAPDLTKFDQYFGPDSSYAAQYDGAFDENSSVNTYKTLTIGRTDWLILSLDFGFSDEVIAWASKIVEAHPNHNVVVTTHAYLYEDGTTLGVGDPDLPTGSGAPNNGEDMWDKFISKHKNIVLVLSGHIGSSKLVTTQVKGDNGNTVTQMLIDPQDLDLTADGPTGMVAMLYFSEDGKTVQVRNYSTVKNKYYGIQNQFSFNIEKVEPTMGDTNNDGVVNILDLVVAKKALTGTNVKFNFNTTDVNIDGCINALDITEIIKKILLS